MRGGCLPGGPPVLLPGPGLREGDVRRAGQRTDQQARAHADPGRDPGRRPVAPVPQPRRGCGTCGHPPPRAPASGDSRSGGSGRQCDRAGPWSRTGTRSYADCAAHGADRRPDRARHTEVHRLRASGRSVREIAAELGVVRNTVRHFLRVTGPGELLEKTAPAAGPASPGLTSLTSVSGGAPAAPTTRCLAADPRPRLPRAGLRRLSAAHAGATAPQAPCLIR
jgi:hypothetical protein